MATSGNPGDVSSTLGELERKLRELEQELARVGHPAATPGEPLVPPPTPIAQAVPDPGAPRDIAAAPAPAPPDGGGADRTMTDRTMTDARLAALEDQLDALRVYGAELQTSAERLLEAYRGALAAAERSPAAPPAVAQAAVVPPVAQAPTVPTPVAPPAAPAPGEPAPRAPIQDPRVQDEIMARFIAAQAAGQQLAAEQPAPEAAAPQAAVPQAPAPEAVVPQAPAPEAVVPQAAGAFDQRYLGAVTVDAGPFVDIASLSAFEQAIARVPGVRDVYVRGFQGQRAVIDIDFGTPTALVPELAAVTTVPFVVERADATGLVVTIAPVSPDARA